MSTIESMECQLEQANAALRAAQSDVGYFQGEADRLAAEILKARAHQFQPGDVIVSKMFPTSRYVVLSGGRLFGVTGVNRGREYQPHNWTLANYSKFEFPSGRDDV